MARRRLLCSLATPRRPARSLPRRLLLNASERAEGQTRHGPFGR